MHTTITPKGPVTTITDTDRNRLLLLLKRTSPLMVMDLKPPGHWRTMSSDDRWLQIVQQVCVTASARGMAAIMTDPDRRLSFSRAVSISTWKQNGFGDQYLAPILRKFKAVRFHSKAAARLRIVVGNLKCVKAGRVVLFDRLPQTANAIREELMSRCPVFGCKSVSDFMIDAGLSRDVIALDTRVIGALKRYFEYQLFSTLRAPSQAPIGLSLKATIPRLQADKRLYLSLEKELRAICTEAKTSLAVLDQVLFRLSAMDALQFLMKEVDSTLREEPAAASKNANTRAGRVGTAAA